MTHSNSGTVVLTGGHGFIGSQVTRRLAERGDVLTLLTRKASRTHRVDDLTFRRVEGDVLDASTLLAAFEGQSACVHLACITAWSQMHDDKLERTIEEGTRNVLEAAAKAGVRRVVFVSSVAALGGTAEPQVFDETTRIPLDDPRMRYAIAKRKTEDAALALAAKLGLELIIVRPGEVYGPNDDGFITAGSLRDILSGWPAVAVRGGVSVVHLDDVAQGIVAALDRGRAGEAYLLGGENVTVEQIVRLTLKAAGRSTPVVTVPSAVLRAAVAACVRLGVRPPVEPGVLPYVTRYFFVSTKKAEAELGFRPRGAAESIASAVHWLHTAGHVPSR